MPRRKPATPDLFTEREPKPGECAQCGAFHDGGGDECPCCGVVYDDGEGAGMADDYQQCPACGHNWNPSLIFFLGTAWSPVWKR